MKLKHVWVALIALTFFGCDDNTGSLGLGMFPGSDQNIKGNLITFDVTTQSELAEKVFAKTSIGYVGKFTDPFFGYYEAGFLSQLHCTEGMTFPTVYSEKNPTGVMVKDDIYLTELILSYSSYFGDSLNACSMSIYELNKDIDKNDALYTDINPSDYYNTTTGFIGRKAYSAVDLSIKDSIRNLSNFYPYVRSTLPKSIGTKIYEACKAAGKDGLSNAEFQKVFKGIYVKSDYGDGTVLYVDQIELNIAYEVYVKDSTNTKVLKKKYEKDEAGNLKDSTAYSKRTFVATKEIIQANQFKSDNQQINDRQKETEWTYLKTPAGIYTQASLPLKEIEVKLSKDTINAVKLAFTTYNQTNDYNKYKFRMNAPKNVLLVREKDREKFFEKNKIADNVTSYLSQHSAISTNQYIFSNLTKLISVCLAEKEEARKKAGNAWDEAKWLSENPTWDKVALIPVLVSYDTSSSNPNVIGVQNDLRPGYAKLKGGADGLIPTNKENKLKLEVIYTSFNGEKK